jgi:hypothetical protein
MQPGKAVGRRRSAQGGYLLVVMMFALALFGVGLATVGQWTSEIVRRDQEAQLLRSGTEVVAAIGSYFKASPGAFKLPTSWDDLLEDRRFIGTVRHLRRVPVDPFSHRAEWTIVRDSRGSMIGIRSMSTGQPLTQVPVRNGHASLQPAACYCDWQFVFDVDQAPLRSSLPSDSNSQAR